MTLRGTRPALGLMLTASLTLLSCTASWAITKAPCANMHADMQAHCKDMVQKKQTAQHANQQAIAQKYQAIADHYHAQVHAQQQMQDAAAQAPDQHASPTGAPATERPLPPSLSQPPMTHSSTAGPHQNMQTAPTASQTIAAPTHEAPQSTASTVTQPTSSTGTNPPATTPAATETPSQDITPKQPAGETRFQINYH